MFFDHNHNYLFRCEDCQTLLIVEFKEEDEQEQLNNDKITLECPCSGICKVLRN